VTEGFFWTGILKGTLYSHYEKMVLAKSKTIDFVILLAARSAYRYELGDFIQR
jgi:hypothetical protein